ncbi:AAA 12, and/or ResIII domain containing protein [Asbolus verrucosus]|uniref:AAA 12, and/or ResIII domain containing protein n=1 Tax=Asbolus verrucosus TaxID=1661398 RepID=A0A482VZ59_ASBVE|nr:AAA 12, and/or ResIII domain containing protein [Asbolus verrucosus]
MLGHHVSLRKNIINGKFQNVQHYLNIQFLLLREDFVSSLRKGIQSHRSGGPTTNLEIYKKVKIFKEEKVYKLKLLDHDYPRNIEETKKFMSGSLLVFTKNDFGTTFLAKVIRRDEDEDDDKMHDEIIIELVDKDRRVFSGTTYTMAECCVFFEPYFQVLSVLQSMSTGNFPMERYIIYAETSDGHLPKYLLKSASMYDIDGYRFSPRRWPTFTKGFNQLNDAQFQAYQAALTQEFVVIQGPPGTGKTFLGLKIVETLIKNHHVWYNNSPILVISHKNHALDQFLEGLLPFTQRIVRVGGQSKSDKLEEFKLANLKDATIRDFKSSTDLKIMQNALVVAMTTTAAARKKKILEKLKCPIVIVEEAAEVRSPTTQIDHIMGKKYHLNVSLFERMVNNGIQCYQLKVQHRMRPEISSLLKLNIYPFLQDHASVKRRSSITGVDRNVFFIDHQYPEAPSNITSKKNSHEAKFLVSLARYLVLNGYKSSDIVILAIYSGQVQEMKNEVNKMLDGELMKAVHISSLDSFQGQESEIVLLSLVRSDKIGFLLETNRVCVALSRAKNGFYIMGNMELLSKNSQLWKSIKANLQRQRAFGTELKLRCQIHPQTVTNINRADDFDNVHLGGCDVKCDSELQCGHRCRLFCHPLDRDHESYQCRNACMRYVHQFLII